MSSDHNSPLSAPLEHPESSKPSSAYSTSNDIPAAHTDSVSLRTHSDAMPQSKHLHRGGQKPAVTSVKRGSFPKNQQHIRNPAGQNPHSAPESNRETRTTSNPGYRPYPSKALHPAAWQSWEEMRIKIFRLPPNTTVQQLISWFRMEGKVHFVEIYENRAEDGTCNACLSFRPPPNRPFWKQRDYSLPSGGRELATCCFGFPERSKTFLYPSPVQLNMSYPETMSIKAESLDFGLTIDQNTILSLKKVTSTVTSPVYLELNMKHKELSAVFEVPIMDWRAEKLGIQVPKTRIPNGMEEFKFKIPLTEVVEISESPIENDCFALAFTPLVPPSFFKRVHNVQASALLKLWTDQDAWSRQTDVVYNLNSLKKAPLTLKNPDAALDLGRWTTYRFIFSRSKNEMRTYQKLRSALQDYNVKIIPCPSLQLASGGRPPVWEHIVEPLDQNSQVNAALQELVHAEWVSYLSFRVRYQLEVCISVGCFNEYNLDRRFIEKLAEMEPNSAQDLLEFVATEKKRIFEPMSIFDLTLSSGATSSTRIPDYCVVVRSATVTPTTIRFHTPSIETSNRVIRQYSEYADRFLRVRFRDEQSESRIFSTNKETMNEVFMRIKRTFSNGIRIGDRQYEYLGYGNSQLREHSAYFFAPTAHVNSKRIRMWMGSFDDIQTVAKYASRLGQCFSTTRAIKGVMPQIEELDDIEHKGYCFTDGVGRISPFLAQLASSELGILQSNQATPSVFQFRLGGCKGVLTVSPTSTKRDLHLRPSQYKFPASHEGLEVIRWSQYACAKLNRQLILVLSTLGVADEIFRRKMENQLQDLTQAMTDPEKALALLHKFVDHNHITLTMAGMINDGFQQSGEPFMLGLLHLWKAWSLKYLKEKAQIAIDGGALLLGCVDETNQLQGHYDNMHKRMPGPEASLEERSHYLPQIFVQLSKDPDDKDGSRPKVILGPVLLTRSPILHPGDLRVVCCVDVPELHHIKDAVVMPQNGDRDLASMCSGGDLDGDDFLVIWDSDFLPKEWNFRPMDYSPPPPLIHGHEITVDDMTTFFVTYMKNDLLGTIANSHVALADYSDQGVKDERCLKLAQSHSQAVDFAKTGQPALMTPDLRPRRKPHFLTNNKKNGKGNCYVSRKVLGQLYDQVTMIEFSPGVSGSFDGRIMEAFEAPMAKLVAARSLKREYDAAVRRIMAKYEIKTEFEVWSTFVLSHSWSNDFKFHEEIGQVSTALKTQFREQCIEIAGGKDIDQLGEFVVAMYQVTAEEVDEAVARGSKALSASDTGIESPKEDSSRPLISFPWIFHDILGKIVHLKASSSSSLISSSLPAQVVSENIFQSKPIKSKALKGRFLVNEKEQVPDLETTQGLVHQGDVFKPFTSQHTKDLERLETEHESQSDIEPPALLSPALREAEPDERQPSMPRALSPLMSSSSSKQSSSMEELTTDLDSGDMESNESNELEEHIDAEDVVVDWGADRSLGNLLERFAVEGEEYEDEEDDEDEGCSVAMCATQDNKVKES